MKAQVSINTFQYRVHDQSTRIHRVITNLTWIVKNLHVESTWNEEIQRAEIEQHHQQSPPGYFSTESTIRREHYSTRALFDKALFVVKHYSPEKGAEGPELLFVESIFRQKHYSTSVSFCRNWKAWIYWYIYRRAILSCNNYSCVTIIIHLIHVSVPLSTCSPALSLEQCWVRLG